MRNWLAMGFAIGVVVAAAGIACDGDGNGTEEGDGTPGATATEQSQTPEVGMTPEVSVDVTISEQGGSGAMGSAVLTTGDSRTDISVTIDGGLEAGEHFLHIHTGACAEAGPFVEALMDLVADAGGTAEVTTSTSQALDTLTDGQHYLVVFGLDQDTPVACGDIPAQF